MTRKQAYWRLTLLLLIFFLVGLANSIWLPLHKAPDEIAHFRYSRFIASTGRLPINPEERTEAGYLSFWPPVYHAAAAVLTGWSDNEATPRLKFTWESDRFDLARELLDTKRLANTEDELWPFRGGVLMWHLGRIVSIVLSMGTIAVAFFTALEIFPKNYRIAVWSAAILAFVPGFIFISSVMSYEALVGLTTGLYFLMLVKIVKGGSHLRYFVLLGLFMGVSVTVKYTTVILPLQVIVVFVFLAFRHSWGWLSWLKRLSVTALASILASIWWFAFLAIYFGETDKFGPVVGILKPILAGGIDASQNYTAAILTGGQIGTTESLEIVYEPFHAWLITMFQTLWVGRIDGYPLWPVAHIIVGLFCLLAMVGLGYVWRRQSQRRIWVGLLVLHVLIFFVFPLLRYLVQGNISWTAQGRHVLFPIATVLPLLLIYGWQGWLSLQVQRGLALALVGGLLCWSMVQVVRIIDYPIYYLPVQTTSDTAQKIPNRLDQKFGEHLVFLGHDLEVSPADHALKAKLYWQSLSYADEDYLMDIALVKNGETQYHWTIYPVNGRYPARIWEPWETIRDDIWLPLVDVPPGNYQLQLQLSGSNGPLPVDEKDTLVLDEITVPAMPPIEPEIHLPLSVEDRQVVTGITLWQAERYRKFNLSEYQPRMQIAFVGQGQLNPDERLQWLLVGPQDQVYPATPVSEHFYYFPVGLDWPSGDYHVRAELWQGEAVFASKESGPILTIDNEKPRLVEPPPVSRYLETNFANRIKLIGYDLPVRSLSSGRGVPVTLYWQGLRTMGRHYTVFTKLLDNEHQVWGSTERLPADGYDTVYWLENEVVFDGFELPVDPAAPNGVYWLNVGLYEEIDGKAVSLPVTTADGQPSEVTSVTFGPIKIGGPPPGLVAREAAPEHPLDTDFGEAIRLRGYDLQQVNKDLQFKLYWESVRQADLDYTVFVHIRNQDNETVAQMDRLLTDNVYPTSLWSPTEIIFDELTVPLPGDLPAGNYVAVVGLYNFETGERLPVAGSMDNTFVLYKFTID